MLTWQVVQEGKKDIKAKVSVAETQAENHWDKFYVSAGEHSTPTPPQLPNFLSLGSILLLLGKIFWQHQLSDIKVSFHHNFISAKTYQVAFDLLQQGADGLKEQLLLTDDHQLVDALPMGR